MKAARALADVTQGQLAQALGISAITVKRFENNGRYNFTVEQIERIAELTDVPLDFLLYGPEDQWEAVGELSHLLATMSELLPSLAKRPTTLRLVAE